MRPDLRVRGRASEHLAVREVAERLAVCSATVYALCGRGELRHIRVSSAIRIRAADLEAFTGRE
jgi:excisionase family DNA binding protein